MKHVLGVVAYIALSIAQVLVRAWAFIKVWTWYLEPSTGWVVGRREAIGVAYISAIIQFATVGMLTSIMIKQAEGDKSNGVWIKILGKQSMSIIGYQLLVLGAWCWYSARGYWL